MATLTRSITIDAPVDQVFAYALDLGRFWAWEDVTLSDVDVKADGLGTSGRMNTHFLGLRVSGHVEYTEVVRDERIVARVHFFVENPTWTFRFAPADDGGTTVTAEGEWEVKVPVVGKRFEGRMVKEHEPYLEALLAHLKAEVEAASAA